MATFWLEIKTDDVESLKAGLEMPQHANVRVRQPVTTFFLCRANEVYTYQVVSYDILTQKHVCLCAAVDCGLLEPPLNGQVMVMGTTLGSRAMYTCNPGYILLGSATRRCKASGLWCGSEPTCSGMGMKPKRPNNPNTMINP